MFEKDRPHITRSSAVSWRLASIMLLAAAMLGARHVHAVESDGDALENAGDNLGRNNVADRVQLAHALVDADFLRRAGQGAFDLIVANVLSGVLRPLLPALRAALAAEGRLILGGILAEESVAMIEAAAVTGFRLRTEDLEDEWWGGAFTRTAQQS